jgi:hypothetical protein
MHRYRKFSLKFIIQRTPRRIFHEQSMMDVAHPSPRSDNKSLASRSADSFSVPPEPCVIHSYHNRVSHFCPVRGGIPSKGMIVEWFCAAAKDFGRKLVTSMSSNRSLRSVEEVPFAYLHHFVEIFV